MNEPKNSYPWPNGCDTSRPLTNPYRDANSRRNHCKWFLNRCHPRGGCHPEEYQAQDDSVWCR